LGPWYRCRFGFALFLRLGQERRLFVKSRHDGKQEKRKKRGAVCVEETDRTPL